MSRSSTVRILEVWHNVSNHENLTLKQESNGAELELVDLDWSAAEEAYLFFRLKVQVK